MADKRDAALLERELELSQLQEALAGAGTVGRLVLIEGPPGAGKSALLARACAVAAERGIEVLAGRGAWLEREVTLGVAMQLLGARVQRAPTRSRERLFAGIAAAARVLFAPPAGEPVAPDPNVLVTALYWLLSNLASRPRGRWLPLAVVVDDAHWADAASLRLLSHIAVRLQELPIALLVAWRPGEAGAAEEPLSALRSQPVATRLAPAPLSENAVAGLMAARLAGAEHEFVAAFTRLTGGNPFLVCELLESLRAGGVKPTVAGVQSLDGLVPESVVRLSLARLGRLSANAGELARAVSVLEDQPLRRIAALAGLEPEPAAAAADELAAAYILAAGEPLRFTHPLLATAVRSELRPFARAERHRRAAGLLDQAGEPPELVAAHLVESPAAGDAMTVAVLRAAAAGALARGSPQDAARLLRRALDEPPDTPARAEVLLELGLAQASAGERGAIESLQQALAATADQQVRARTHHALAQVLFAAGQLAAAAGVADEGLRELDDDDPARQRLLGDVIAAASLDRALAGRAEELLEPLIAAARAGRPPADPGLLAQLAYRLAQGGEAPERVRALAVAATRQDPLVDPSAHGAPMGLLVAALVYVGELGLAEQIAERALIGAYERGSLIAMASASFHRAFARYWRGSIDGTLEDIDRALGANRAGWSTANGWIGQLWANALIERGELDAADEALSLGQTVGEQVIEHGLVLHARARLALARGDAAGALAHALAAGEHLTVHYDTDLPGLVRWRATAALAAAAAGDRRRARGLAEQAVARARRLGPPHALGAALRASALTGEPQRVIEQLRQSVSILKHTPATLEHASSLLELGAALRRAGQRTAAREPLAAALELADAGGATAVSTRALSELHALGARPRRAARTGPGSLTPAERRVAELAAEGYTNQVIANKLFLAPKTVETHLSHTYSKLGISTRHEVADALRPRAPAP